MKFIPEGDQLTVRFEGVEVLLGVKRKFILPRSKIVDAAWYPEFEFKKRVWRAIGAGIFGVLYAGHFRGNGVRYFFYLHEAHGIYWRKSGITTHDTLVLTLQDFPYKQILLSCTQEVGSGVVQWWQLATKRYSE